MKNAKKVFRASAAALLFFCAGFACGYLSHRFGIFGDKGGVAADVSGYLGAEERAGRAADAVADAAGNVREASGEVRIGITEAGEIGSVASDIGSGASLSLDRAGGIEGGILRIMGILDAAEKRNGEMEASGRVGLD
jgi:hypothetical protein